MTGRRIRKASADWAQPKKPAKPERPKHLPFGRWLADLGELSAAEERLVQCCAQGVPWEPEDWDGKPPEEPTEQNSLRAEVIRFLVLGGDADQPVHEEAVMCGGAWITGTLDLHQCRAERRLCFMKCQFEETLELLAASLPELVLSGSILPGLRADRMKVSGGVFLRDKFTAKGETRLLSAEIGGNLDCSGGTFDNPGSAMNADGMIVSGRVLLRDAAFNGAIDLSAARIGTLIDDETCWQAGGHILNGLQYDRIVGPMGARHRIGWLNCQRPDHLNMQDFKPQPWEQLAKVLREMGHTGEAADVAIAKQDAMRKAGRIGQREVKDFSDKSLPDIRHRLDRIWNPISNFVAVAWHWIYGGFAGYGYRPQRILYLMAGLIVLSSLGFYAGRHHGLIGPNDPLVNMSTLTEDCGTGGANGVVFWTDPACPVPPEYSTYQPFFYALDVTLPLVDLHQEADWGPIVVNELGGPLWAGRFLRWLMWFDIIFGWFASLMFVAIVSRLVDKD